MTATSRVPPVSHGVVEGTSLKDAMSGDPGPDSDRATLGPGYSPPRPDGKVPG